eukprot:364508-Chlamydomonas_euryale.AAC.18
MALLPGEKALINTFDAARRCVCWLSRTFRGSRCLDSQGGLARDCVCQLLRVFLRAWDVHPSSFASCPSTHLHRHIQRCATRTSAHLALRAAAPAHAHPHIHTRRSSAARCGAATQDHSWRAG